jgi:molecular chaperone GrpE
MSHDAENNRPSSDSSSYAKMQAEFTSKQGDDHNKTAAHQEENEPTAAESESTTPPPPTPEETLREAQATFDKEIKELTLRHLADQKNLHERHQRETAKARDYAIQGFAQDLLSIADALHQGIESADADHKQGLQLILDVFNQTLAKHHITPLDPKGEAYDPHYHEAMVMQPNPDVENNHIIQVIQVGYKLKDRLLRPARVIVAKNT